MNSSMMRKLIFAVTAVVLIVVTGYILHNNGYNAGYKKGYDVGYSNGYADRNKLVSKEISDAVTANTKTETKIVYKTIPYTGNDVQIKTEKPVVKVEVNGKQQEIKQHSETADLAVKTETEVKIKVPERKWVFGIGTDGKKPMYMLKAPIKDAVGVWVAGGSHKVMGGVSISF